MTLKATKASEGVGWSETVRFVQSKRSLCGMSPGAGWGREVVMARLQVECRKGVTAFFPSGEARCPDLGLWAGGVLSMRGGSEEEKPVRQRNGGRRVPVEGASGGAQEAG